MVSQWWGVGEVIVLLTPSFMLQELWLMLSAQSPGRHCGYVAIVSDFIGTWRVTHAVWIWQNCGRIVPRALACAFILRGLPATTAQSCGTLARMSRNQ